jgi:hypothetical protein
VGYVTASVAQRWLIQRRSRPGGTGRRSAIRRVGNTRPRAVSVAVTRPSRPGSRRLRARPTLGFALAADGPPGAWQRATPTAEMAGYRDVMARIL